MHRHDGAAIAPDTAESRRGRIGLSPGMSLVELLVVLAVIAITLSAGVPMAIDFVHRQRLGVAASELLAAVNVARAEAIRRGTRVDIVPAQDADWAQGWLVMIDRNGNQRADSDDPILHRHGPVSAGILIQAAFTDSRTQYVAYTASGQTRTNASSQSRQLGSWSLSFGEHSRRVIINFLGRPRLCNPALEPSTC